MYFDSSIMLLSAIYLFSSPHFEKSTCPTHRPVCHLPQTLNLLWKCLISLRIPSVVLNPMPSLHTVNTQ